jgi:hypothetical protein
MPKPAEVDTNNMHSNNIHLNFCTTGLTSQGKLNTHAYLQKHAYKQASFDSKWQKCLIFPDNQSRVVLVTEESETDGDEQHSGTDFRL